MTAYHVSLIDAVAATGATVRTHADGRVIFVKGSEADFAYVVKQGRVEVRESGRVLERIGEGEIFGEVGLIDGGPRSASAVAVGETEVFTIDRETFDRLVRENHDFVVALMRDMARRLRATNARSRPTGGLPTASLPPVA